MPTVDAGVQPEQTPQPRVLRPECFKLRQHVVARSTLSSHLDIVAHGDARCRDQPRLAERHAFHSATPATVEAMTGLWRDVELARQ